MGSKQDKKDRTGQTDRQRQEAKKDKCDRTDQDRQIRRDYEKQMTGHDRADRQQGTKKNNWDGTGQMDRQILTGILNPVSEERQRSKGI